LVQPVSAGSFDLDHCSERGMKRLLTAQDGSTNLPSNEIIGFGDFVPPM
jgi:hypothetical protein